ncbi:MAG: hypothetical protein WC710_15045 [Gallionella sp.]|jgi:hypothetical protein
MNVEDGNVHLLRNKNFPQNGTGLSLDPEYLVTGHNSGYQAINLAVLSGAKKIILLGYDAHDPKPNEVTHWFGNHPRREPQAVFALYRQACKSGAAAIKAAGVRVINCSPGSAIDAFERLELDQALGL